MIKVLTFEKEHLKRMDNPKDFYKREGDVLASLMCLEGMPNNIAMSFEYNDKILGVLGASMYWPGVMQAWAILTDTIKERPIEFHKCAKRVIETYALAFKLFRMQMEVRMDCPDNMKWAEALGFSQESVLKCYGADKSDYYLYARLF